MSPKRKAKPSNRDVQMAGTSNQLEAESQGLIQPSASPQHPQTANDEVLHLIINALGQVTHAVNSPSTVGVPLRTPSVEPLSPIQGFPTLQRSVGVQTSPEPPSSAQRSIGIQSSGRPSQSAQPSSSAQLSSSAQPGVDAQNPDQAATSASNEVFVLYIEAGCGGTFVKGHASDARGGIPMGDVRYIGFDNCINELGVHFDIGTNRCFCCRLVLNPWFSPDDKIHSRFYDTIREQIIARFNWEAETYGCDVSDVNLRSIYLTSCHSDFNESTAFGCNNCTIVESCVSEFLGRDQPFGAARCEREELPGFVTEPGTGGGNIEEVWYTDFDDSGRPTQESNRLRIHSCSSFGGGSRRMDLCTPVRSQATQRHKTAGSHTVILKLFFFSECDSVKSC